MHRLVQIEINKGHGQGDKEIQEENTLNASIHVSMGRM